jgi:anti-sigma factor ChrR (cupin superfamily)
MIAAGDQRALRALYEHTHRLVFTLIECITNNRETAEELTIDVFREVWRRGSKYDAAGGSVVGWIMNHARSRAIDRLCFDSRKKRVNDHPNLPPSEPLWASLARCIGAETAAEPPSPLPDWAEPKWMEVSPGISVKLLATDAERDRVSMLVRLGPGVDYPPHRHAGVEELHLLDGELMIDDKKLYPGDYVQALPGTADNRVWSETGCTCVLVTSPKDLLR